jgi:hypothetical protein
VCADVVASRAADFRYMATSDLLNELQKDSFRLDAEGERRVCQARASTGLSRVARAFFTRRVLTRATAARRWC